MRTENTGLSFNDLLSKRDPAETSYPQREIARQKLVAENSVTAAVAKPSNEYNEQLDALEDSLRKAVEGHLKTTIYQKVEEFCNLPNFQGCELAYFTIEDVFFSVIDKNRKPIPNPTPDQVFNNLVNALVTNIEHIDFDKEGDEADLLIARHVRDNPFNPYEAPSNIPPGINVLVAQENEQKPVFALSRSKSEGGNNLLPSREFWIIVNILNEDVTLRKVLEQYKETLVALKTQAAIDKEALLFDSVLKSPLWGNERQSTLEYDFRTKQQVPLWSGFPDQNGNPLLSINLISQGKTYTRADYPDGEGVTEFFDHKNDIFSVTGPLSESPDFSYRLLHQGNVLDSSNKRSLLTSSGEHANTLNLHAMIRQGWPLMLRLVIKDLPLYITIAEVPSETNNYQFVIHSNNERLAKAESALPSQESLEQLSENDRAVFFINKAQELAVQDGQTLTPELLNEHLTTLYQVFALRGGTLNQESTPAQASEGVYLDNGEKKKKNGEKLNDLLDYGKLFYQDSILTEDEKELQENMAAELNEEAELEETQKTAAGDAYLSTVTRKAITPQRKAEIEKIQTKLNKKKEEHTNFFVMLFSGGLRSFKPSFVEEQKASTPPSSQEQALLWILASETDAIFLERVLAHIEALTAQDAKKDYRTDPIPAKLKLIGQRTGLLKTKRSKLDMLSLFYADEMDTLYKAHLLYVQHTKNIEKKIKLQQEKVKNDKKSDADLELARTRLDENANTNANQNLAADIVSKIRSLFKL